MQGGSQEQLAIPLEEMVQRRKRGILQKLGRFIKTKPLGAFGGFLMIGSIFVAVFADVISPYDPLEFHTVDRLTGYSGSYWLGTDQFGRDVLSRVIHGARISVMVGVFATLFGASTGGIIGIVSGYLMGKFDIIVQRIVDILMSFPLLILALAIVAALGPSTLNVIIAISFVFAPRVARITRSSAIAVRERQYVDAARAMGAVDFRIISRHVLPNCVAPWLVIATAELGSAILAESSLSFLGLGTQEPNPSLGAMLSGAAGGYFEEAPWMAIWPGFAIGIAVFGFNILGDALRDVLDPRLRRG